MAAAADDLLERERNLLLRLVDWRFLLPMTERPRALNLAGGRLAAAVTMISDPADKGPADLAVLRRPASAEFRRARAGLRPGGAVYCEWTLPIPMRSRSTRAALARAGFEPQAVIWPGPRAGSSPPQFWVPIESRVATAHLLAARPPQGPRDALLRGAWRLAAQSGALAPLGIVACRRDASTAPGGGDELAALVDDVPTDSWLLLTGGHRSINKVVALGFRRGSPSPKFVVKFARVPEAEASLAHEATVLRTIAEEHPELSGVPRLLATGSRVGCAALAQTALAGTPLMSRLTFDTFPRLAEQVTDWLLSLATRSEPQPPAIWRDRLVDEAVRVFDRQFGVVVGDELLGRIQQRLAGLGPQPQVLEHRDCAPWNILLTDRGVPVLLDWESAEPNGLPVLDLVYFLSNAAFVLESALELGRTPQSYRALLAPGTRTGRVAESCLSRYCQSLGLDRSDVPALRLLTWLVHSRSDFRHLELEPEAAPTPSALRRSPFLGLVEEELRSPAA
jgi:hypothetical protein